MMFGRMGIALCVLLAGACTNLSFSPSDEDAKLVTFPSNSVSLERHDVLAVKAEYIFGATVDPATDGTWTSSNAAVATIQGTGAQIHVSAVAPGTSTIRITGDVIETSIEVVVRTPHPVSLLVSPPQPQTTVGSDVAMTAIATMSDGDFVDATATATWKSSTTSVATVVAGTVHGVAKGESVISAELDSTFSSTRVTVK